MNPRTHRLAVVVGIAWGLLLCAPQTSAQSVPAGLRGQIIANAKPINIPSSSKGFVKKLRKQDRKQFRKNDQGQWQIHFVAFFRRPLPAEQIGVVVIDDKKGPVAVANVAGSKGQTTLAAHITIDSTETPGKPHILQVYFPKGKTPVVLAKKQIFLK